MNLFYNLINNFLLLQNDFTGFSLSLQGIVHFFIHIFIAVIILLTYYLFGQKLSWAFFKVNNKFAFFINVALGYIAISTGLAVLGLFSFLQKEIIGGYLLVTLFIAFYPIPRRNYQNVSIVNLSFIIKSKMKRIFNRKNAVLWGVFLFVVIAFFRLMTPEIVEDGYHTDLPFLYLRSHTTIHEARDPLRVIPYPQLAEMTYLIPIFLGDKEVARFIHFGFYLLIIFLLYLIARSKEYFFAKFAPLFFVTSPIVIRYTSTSYIDFFMIFCFLLSILLIETNGKKQLLLSGIIFGGAIATKLWLIVYLPVICVYIGYLHRRIKIVQILKLVLIFLLSSLSVAIVWYIRDFIITGSPIYPVFAKPEYLEIGRITTDVKHSFGFNWKMFLPGNLIVLSPLIFIAIFFSIFNIKKITKILKKRHLFIFFLILTAEQLFVSVYLGRHLLAWYIIAIIILSAGMYVVLGRNRIAKYSFILLYSLLFIYYSINTLFILFYGFGWADQNKYLTRVLGRDNANYYDFDHLFNVWISDKDLVATYGIVSYYYADFSYIDVNYIFSKKQRSFNLLKRYGITKLLIKGGDIKWFCNILSLTQCDANKVKLLASWPRDSKKYNLYELK